MLKERLLNLSKNLPLLAFYEGLLVVFAHFVLILSVSIIAIIIILIIIVIILVIIFVIILIIAIITHLIQLNLVDQLLIFNFILKTTEKSFIYLLMLIYLNFFF